MVRGRTSTTQDTLPRGEAAPITVTHKLLSGIWSDTVETAEQAISRYEFSRTSLNRCHIALFEVPGDSRLHVNVTHRQQTKTISGWDGPGNVPDGFVHNRRFTSAQPSHVLRHIRSMVFAERV